MLCWQCIGRPQQPPLWCTKNLLFGTHMSQYGHRQILSVSVEVNQVGRNISLVSVGHIRYADSLVENCIEIHEFQLHECSESKSWQFSKRKICFFLPRTSVSPCMRLQVLAKRIASNGDKYSSMMSFRTSFAMFFIFKLKVESSSGWQ